MPTSTLLQIHTLATQLQDLFNVQTEEHAESSSCEIFPLLLELPRRHDLSPDLANFGIPPDSQIALLELYMVKITQLEHEYQAQYRKAMLAMYQLERGNLDDKFLAAFREVLTHKFSTQTSEAWKILNQAVGMHLEGHDQKSPAEQLLHFGRIVTSCYDVSNRTNRGHDSDAVRILEQAFNHSPNITQAEKYQLAEVTGLKPKQVTIWVSSIFFAKRFASRPCVDAYLLLDDDETLLM